MDKRLLWVWLSLACTPGSQTFKKLYDKFGSVEAIYEATDKQINSTINPRSSDRAAVTEKELDKAKLVLDFCISKQVGIVTYEDDAYPKTLRSIDNPPVLLYYRGILPDFKKHISIGVVGTRKLSSYGRKCAYELSYDLACSGAIIVSGMAKGIDGVAHTAALSAGMPTVAVLGSGINVCYPKEHLQLAREIVKCGCVITEYPPFAKPLGFHFPCRNRIISGIPQGVLLIEGTERSGALITATRAKEQGKLVYAVPGNVGSKNSEASNIMLKDGAKLTTCAEDIISDFENHGEALLNRFKLKEHRPDLYEAMRNSGASAITADDFSFAPKIKRPPVGIDNAPTTGATLRVAAAPELKKSEPNTEEAPAFGFDKIALTVYKRIPEGVECSFESLAGDGIDVRDVAKAVLKLQIGGFVTVYPGDTVARKFKG